MVFYEYSLDETFEIKKKQKRNLSFIRSFSFCYYGKVGQFLMIISLHIIFFIMIYIRKSMHIQKQSSFICSLKTSSFFLIFILSKIFKLRLRAVFNAFDLLAAHLQPVV